MPIPSLQRRLQICRAPFSAPDQLQATHHRPHLMMEEGTGGDVKQDGLALTPDIEPIQRLHRALRLAMRRAESRKVVQPRQALRRLRSEEPTSELQSLMRISYSGFFLETK